MDYLGLGHSKQELWLTVVKKQTKPRLNFCDEQQTIIEKVSRGKAK